MKLNELIVYRNLLNEKILSDVHLIINNIDKKELYSELKNMLFEAISGIIEIADKHGFEGNLWHVYITYLLVNDENSYSKATEIKGKIEGGINRAVLHDFEIIQKYFKYDFAKVDKVLGTNSCSLIGNYTPTQTAKKLYNTRIQARICNLSKELEMSQNAEDFLDIVTAFYKEYGVGKFGLHKAFRINGTEGETEIKPITNITHVALSDLVGYEIAKKKLIDNTQAFIDGKKANNCLLFGDSGTGKSTCIKAILNQYFGEGLRVIEVYKHQFQNLNDIITEIKNRNYKFIIYMDDLSFEEFEIEYKYLKAVIEGGLEKKPENVLIYATSNRKNLIRQDFSDRDDMRGDVRTSDTLQEKMSLVARFGETIYFGSPNVKEFKQIVITLAEKNGIDLREEELLKLANTWEVNHGGKSGRTAQQFIDHLLGTL